MTVKLRGMICSIIFVLITGLMPHSSFAYSYGNPSEEAVAEVYKQVVAALNQSPADFNAATQAFQSIHNELDMHMGKEPGQVIEGALTQKNKDLTINAFQRTLVLNIARRLESIDKDFSNYKDNKTLLAKALATYDALSPVVKAKDTALDERIHKDFEDSLQALGNPGLFGVGVKEPNPNVFKEKEKEILSGLQSHFQMASLEVGHFSEGTGPDNPLSPKNSSGMGNLKNWLPIVLVVLVLAFIVVRTMRRRRSS